MNRAQPPLTAWSTLTWPSGGTRGAEIGLDTVDEDRDVGSDGAGLVDDVVADAWFAGEEVSQDRLHGSAGQLLIDARSHGVREKTGQTQPDTQPLTSIAPILGKDGASSSQDSPLSSVSQSLPPVVPKQKRPL